jgi:formate dehydrogenase iron-sulfur subunit
MFDDELDRKPGLPISGGREAVATSGIRIEPGRDYGFFTDTTLCIGCKACEVACKEWNILPAEEDELTGMSYDNTGGLSATTWRHVAFVEQVGEGRSPGYPDRWLMMSDVCKHCDPAPCLEACPTGAIFRSEFGSVVVQQDICNGCGYCVPACPFGVVAVDEDDGKAHKCTLCYDRMKGGLEPACAKACPTDSIQFGEIGELTARARDRVSDLHARGTTEAYLYGTPGDPGANAGVEKLNAFFLLLDRPEVYNLPAAPTRPADRIAPAFGAGLAAFAGLAAAAAALLLSDTRGRR